MSLDGVKAALEKPAPISQKALIGCSVVVVGLLGLFAWIGLSGSSKLPDGITYRIIQEDCDHERCKIDVALNKEIDTEVLQIIAEEIKEQFDFEKAFIFYYLPDLVPANGESYRGGSWAYTHFTSELEIRILYNNEKVDQIPHYNDLDSLLSDSYFGGAQGEYEIKGDSEISIGRKFLSTEDPKIMKDYVKRDILMMSFEIFAKSDRDRVIITAYPIIENFETKESYKAKIHGITAGINRTNALALLRANFGSDDLKMIYQKYDSGGSVLIYHPRFERLLYGDVDRSYDQLLRGL
jgi:hypothetical protein